jgi:hypothetical protein
MEKRYFVSGGLSGLEWTSFLAFFGLLIICWLCVFCSGFLDVGSAAADYRGLAFSSSLTVLFLVIVRLILARDMLKTIWDVSETSITRKSPSRIVSVDFDRIIRFRYCHVPLLFSVGAIRHEGGKLYLSFYIQDLAGLISDIRDGLKRSQNTNACDASNLDEYARAARTAGLRSDRLKRFTPSLLSALSVMLCVCIVTSLCLWHFPLALVFMWAVVVLLLFMSSIMIAEALLSANFRRAEIPEGRSCEAQVYLLSGMFAFVLCLCCGILLSTVFAL